MARRSFPILAIVAGLVSFAFAWRRSAPKRGRRFEQLATAVRKEQAPRTPPASGREATAPQMIPPRGWWQIAKRTVAQFSANELLSEAASVTFYALLSLFPALTAFVSIYGLFADPAAISAHIDALANFLPGGGIDIVKEQLHRLEQSPRAGLSIGAIVGLLTALWSANQGSKAMISALNDVYGETEGRGFVKLTAISLAFTVGGIVALVFALGLIVILPLVFKAVGLDTLFNAAVTYIRWPVILLGIITALALLYRFAPDRVRARWRWISWGSTLGALFWILVSVGFSWYVQNFGSYNKTYGSLGAIVGFMTWIWLSSAALLLGAQVNAEMERQTARDTTVGGAKPIGHRGAAVADEVA